jgi:hypothetical protein
VDAVERLFGCRCGCRAVEPFHEPARKRALRIARAQIDGRVAVEQQRVPIGESRVRDAQCLAIDVSRGLGYADVVVKRLRHLLLAIGSDEQPEREDHLLRLAVGPLDVPAEQEVELLVGGAELDVGPDADRIESL